MKKLPNNWKFYSLIAASMLVTVVSLRFAEEPTESPLSLALRYDHVATEEVFDPWPQPETVATIDVTPEPEATLLTVEPSRDLNTSDSVAINEIQPLPAPKADPVKPITSAPAQIVAATPQGPASENLNTQAIQQVTTATLAGEPEVKHALAINERDNWANSISTMEASSEIAEILTSDAAPAPVVGDTTWFEPVNEEFKGFVSQAAPDFDLARTDSSFVVPADGSAGLESELRLAMLPQEQKKPRFKRFGASKPNEDKDDDEDDVPPPKQPVVLSASNRWKMAPAPVEGYRYKDDTPLTDACSYFVEGAEGNFSPTPTMQGVPYDPYGNMNVYQGKTLNATQRPLLELGRPWYQLGPITEGSSILGFHNNVNPQYIVFGDFRTGVASNRVNGDTTTQIASQLNLFHHFKFTSTERFVAGHTPLTSGGRNTRYVFDDDEFEFEGNANFNFAYFEGDIGALVGGATGKTLPFDLPFAIGIMPLVFQNGIWMEDDILGFAITRPARNSAKFDISNMDITFFAGYDRLNSDAFPGDDSAARVVGIASFIDAMNGHFEIDYAFLDDRRNDNRSYHNFAFGFTRRYGRLISNSTRIIVNAGQDPSVPQTADGVLLLSENSLITGSPTFIVPYLNMFAGFDRPQSVGRAGIAGGILRNTGILFESDNLTGYPTLDDTANDTFGMAMGLNLLADEFAQQFIIEMAMLGVMGEDANRNAQGDQYGVGVRYQLPLNNSVIFRADAMVGFLRGEEDINGGRMEIRKKW